ncbi:MAG: AMP-binding protein [Cytophagales bacterium]|nr:AMP-binding protein [Cytophagales bacterium]
MADRATPTAFLGCLYAGIVPVAVNTLLPADDLAYMLEHSRSRAAIVSEALAKAPAHEVQHTLVSKASSPQAFLDKGCQPMPNPAPTQPSYLAKRCWVSKSPMCCSLPPNYFLLMDKAYVVLKSGQAASDALRAESYRRLSNQN